MRARKSKSPIDRPLLPFVSLTMGTSLIKRKELTIQDLLMKDYPKWITKSLKEHDWSKHVETTMAFWYIRGTKQVHSLQIPYSQRIQVTSMKRLIGHPQEHCLE